jgi:hypothetical protein
MEKLRLRVYKIEINGRGDPQKLTLTSPTCGGHSVGIVRLWTKATEFSFMY